MGGKFEDFTEALEEVYRPFRKFYRGFNIPVEPPPTTITLLAQQAVERLKPSPRCRWIRDEEGRIKMDPKPAKYMGDLAGVWVHYESARRGSGRELIRLGVEEEEGEFVLRARRW